MKQFHLYIVSVALLLLSACSSDNDKLPGGGDNTQPAVLRIEVSASDFTNSTNTRATDNGNTTTFENGDRIGIIVVDNNNNVLYNNIPYKYNGSTWSFDSDNNESKTAIYYDYTDGNLLTYLAYFPYSADVNSVNSINGLKEKFQPQTDQRSKDAYRASDLLVWNTERGTPLKKLDIAFAHAYSSLSLSPLIKCKINGGTDFTYVPSGISDVSFTIGEEPLLPYQASDGSYRIVVSPKETGARWLFAYGNEMHSGTMSSKTLSANTRYTLTPTIDIDEYKLAKAKVGDFYCSAASTDETGYLIPGEATSLPEGTNCLGIVYWVGNITDDNYNLLDKKFPNGTHGWVVSLWDMPDPAPDNDSDYNMKWTYGGNEYVNNWLKNAKWSEGNNRPNDFTSIQVTDKMQGYANTLALVEYNNYVEGKTGDGYGQYGSKRVKPVKGLAAFQTKHPAPSNSSGWYWPSIYELKYMCWGKVNSQNTSGKDMLDEQIKKAVGDNFANWPPYWSSTEATQWGHAWFVNFNGGYVNSNSKIDCTFRVRPLLAF